MIKHPTTWILVADAAHARVVRSTGPGSDLVDVAGYSTTNELPPGRELHRDQLPRTHESVGSTRHAMAPREDPRRRLKYDFAATLADRLAAAAAAKEFDRLVVVAPPEMLGDLRRLLPASLQKLVAAEFAKDLVKIANADLRSHFGDGLMI